MRSRPRGLSVFSETVQTHSVHYFYCRSTVASAFNPYYAGRFASERKNDNGTEGEYSKADEDQAKVEDEGHHFTDVVHSIFRPFDVRR